MRRGRAARTDPTGRQEAAGDGLDAEAAGEDTKGDSIANIVEQVSPVTWIVSGLYRGTGYRHHLGGGKSRTLWDRWANTEPYRQCLGQMNV